MKIKHVFDLIFSDDNLYEAIQDASKGRRYNKDVLRVQHDIWNVIEQIQQDVRSGKYTIDKYYIFYVYEPKKRMIMSITFYHRIVQWAIYRVINPLLVKGYIKDTYGCIPGRGSLAAMQRLRYWIKSVEHYRIWPHYVTIRKSTTLEMKRHLRRKVEEYNAGLIEMEVVTATLKSYLGMLDHCDCKEFRKELIDSVVLDRNKVVGEIAYEVENYSEAMVCGL